MPYAPAMQTKTETISGPNLEDVTLRMMRRLNEMASFGWRLTHVGKPSGSLSQPEFELTWEK